jgi:hypothetical protein
VWPWKVSHCLHAVCAVSHVDCLDVDDLVLSSMSWCNIYILIIPTTNIYVNVAQYQYDDYEPSI